jgi:heat shock protein HtpX
MIKSAWKKNRAITTIQSLALVVSLAVLLGLMGWLLGGQTFAAGAIGAVVVFYFLNPMVSPTIVMRMFRGRRLAFQDAPHLYRPLKTLSERAELPRMPVLYYLPHSAMNAFTVGVSGNAAIAVSGGLLRKLDADEVSAVLAHEISHIRHNDIRIMGFAALSSRFIHMLSLFGQFLLFINLPLFLMGQYTISWVAIILLILAPSISAILQLALSRTREYRADLGAAELTGSPESLATALSKMDIERTSYFRLLWPSRARVPSSPLMRTHPPTEERIRRLLEIRDSRRYSAPQFPYSGVFLPKHRVSFHPSRSSWNLLRLGSLP